MSAECVRAQELLSLALDREPVDAASFAAARAHCRECAECAAFARGLALLHRAVVPSPDAELANRVIRAIRAEATEAQPADSALSEDVASTSTAVPAASVTPARGLLTWIKGLGREELWKIGAWTGAAAAVIIVAGFAAVSGVRSILTPATTQDSASLTKGEAATSDLGVATGENADRSAADSTAASASGLGAPSQGEASFIAVDGVAYRSVGMAEIPRSSLTTAGFTTTSLDTGAVAQSYTVYATPTAGRVAIISAAGTRVFELIKRQLEGRTYVLTTETLIGFGEWPGLPAAFTQPTTADGAPTFMKAGLDDLGVQTYLMPGTPIEQGFAVAPTTSATDPAMGNPNWTWWAVP